MPAATTCFVDAVPLSDLTPDRGTQVLIAGVRIALFVVDGRIVAVEDGCVQCGLSFFGNTPQGNLLTCASCGWTYDLPSAALVRMPTLQLNTFTVHAENGRVLIEWPLPPS
jgi:nitrite reductase/ring-hydroxylating ferredoxin subunit